MVVHGAKSRGGYMGLFVISGLKEEETRHDETWLTVCTIASTMPSTGDHFAVVAVVVLWGFVRLRLTKRGRILALSSCSSAAADDARPPPLSSRRTRRFID